MSIISSRRGLHILVVDCDKDSVEVTINMLECLGFTARSERESLSALKAFSEYPDKFDLAIVEPVMPDLMGVELAVRFRRIRRGFPVMLYSGCIDPLLADTIEAHGLGQALLKPLGMEEMGKAVKEAVRRPLTDIH